MEDKASSQSTTGCRNSYRHHALESGGRFRTLRLQPSESPEAQLYCTLEESPLDETCDYEALSYAWDAQVPSRCLICDGLGLEITANCESALRRLRLVDRTRNLWVDSVCIDQASDTEKSHQVALMPEIYSLAQRVVVWLGERNEKSDLAFEYLENTLLSQSLIFKQFNTTDFMKEYYEQGWNELQSKSDAIYKRDDPRFYYRPRRSVIDDIFCRSWFTRAWTLQEVALSKSCLVICGDATMIWEGLTLCVTFLKHLSDDIWFINTILPALPHLYAKMTQQFEIQTNLEEVLTTCRPLKAAKKEDKIFSLYWLLRKIVPSFPTPVYSKPLADIYREATVVLLQQSNALRLFDTCFDLDDSFPRPSWVPDWSSDVGCPFGRASASQNSEPQFSLSPDHKRLNVFGTLVDKIRLTTTPLPRFKRGLNDYDEPIEKRISIRIKFIQTWATWVRDMRSLPPYDSTERAIYALWSLLMDLGKRDQSLWPDNDYAQLFLALLIQEPNAEQKERVEEGLRSLTSARYATEFVPYFDIPEIAKYTILHFSNLSPVLNQMKSLAPASYTFLATASGYLGFAPMFTAEDDLLVLFSGVEYPLIVRPLNERHYRLIGPAWIQGMMDGELWQQGDKLKEFAIC